MEEEAPWGRAIGPFVQMRDDGVYLMDFGASPTDAQTQEHVVEFGAWCQANRRPLRGIVRLHALLHGTPKQRRMIADLEKELEACDAQFMRMCAIVAPNALTRGLVTAVFWLSPPVYPYRVFATMEEAVAAVAPSAEDTHTGFDH